MPRSAPAIKLMDDEREMLERRMRSPLVGRRMRERAGIILAVAAGKSNRDVARRLHVDEAKVSRWRRRFAERGIRGLSDAPRSGRPSTVAVEGTTLGSRIPGSGASRGGPCGPSELEPREVEVCGLYLDRVRSALVIAVDRLGPGGSSWGSASTRHADRGTGRQGRRESARAAAATGFIGFFDAVRRACGPSTHLHVLLDEVGAEPSGAPGIRRDDCGRTRWLLSGSYDVWRQHVTDWLSILGTHRGILSPAYRRILRSIQPYADRDQPLAWLAAHARRARSGRPSVRGSMRRPYVRPVAPGPVNPLRGKGLRN